MFRPRPSPFLRQVCWRCRSFNSNPRRLYANIVQEAEELTNPDHPFPQAAEIGSLSEAHANAIPDSPDKYIQNGIRRYKPRTPGTRHLRRPVNDHLHKGGPHLPLTFRRKGQHIGGRNHTGRIMVRHRGGGVKRRIRMLDWSRFERNPQKVERIEYDPGRSAHIALVYKLMANGDDPPEGEKKQYSYILAADGMRESDKIISYRRGLPPHLKGLDPGMLAAEVIARGNCLPIHLIPSGTPVYNVGLKQSGGGQLCRSAGTFATILGWEEHANRFLYKRVKLKSGEIRLVHRNACATIGVASNIMHSNRQLGKAGRSRLLGIRPTVRGVAMNAADHPHGGGRGKSKGNVHPVSIWGVLTKSGYKTRNRGPNKAVVVERPRSARREAKKSGKKK